MLRRLFLLTHSLPQCVYCALYSCTVITCTEGNGHLSDEGVRGKLQLKQTMRLMRTDCLVIIIVVRGSAVNVGVT